MVAKLGSLVGLLALGGCCLGVVTEVRGESATSGQTIASGSGSTGGISATGGASSSQGSIGPSSSGTTGTGGGGTSSSTGTTGKARTTTTGGAIDPDAGTCSIDGHHIAAGTWLDPDYGSCTICDPAVNPAGWTELDAGTLCRGFATANGYPLLPYQGECYPDILARSACACDLPGAGCGASLGAVCCGGYCDSDNRCVLTQNLGWFTSCRSSTTCAQGPCCLDAGYGGLTDGGGWCCGLIDGGEPICLGAGNVCHADSDCCSGLACRGEALIYEDGGGYGVCQ